MIKFPTSALGLPNVERRRGVPPFNGRPTYSIWSARGTRYIARWWPSGWRALPASAVDGWQTFSRPTLIALALHIGDPDNAKA